MFSDLMSPWATWTSAQGIVMTYLASSSVPERCEKLKGDPFLLYDRQVWLGAGQEHQL